jgi:hypothetical protein
MVDEDLALYSSAYEHELTDPAGRSALLHALGRTREPEQRVALYKTLSYRADGEAWPDIMDFCRLAVTDVSEHPAIRYSAISRLSICPSPEFASLFKDAFLMEVARSDGHLSVARNALSALVKTDAKSFVSDPSLELVLPTYLRRLAVDKEYQSQLTAVMADMRSFFTPSLVASLQRVVNELAQSDSESAKLLQSAMKSGGE